MTDLATLKRVLVTLSRDRYTYLVRGFLKLKPTSGLSTGELFTLRPPQVLTLALFDWLEHLGCIEGSKQERLLGHFAAPLARLADEYAARPPLRPRAALSVADGRYASLFVCQNGSSELFDLTYNEVVQAMPVAAVTHITCDLHALFERVATRLRQVGGTDVRSNDQAAAERPAGDPRDATG